jgi:hypothetical protein
VAGFMQTQTHTEMSNIGLSKQTKYHTGRLSEDTADIGLNRNPYHMIRLSESFKVAIQRDEDGVLWSIKVWSQPIPNGIGSSLIPSKTGVRWMTHGEDCTLFNERGFTLPTGFVSLANAKEFVPTIAKIHTTVVVQHEVVFDGARHF